MRPVVLIVLDGWGVAPKSPGNAISLSSLPFYNSLLGSYPHGLLEASGEAVGLPRGESGNTETGHLNLGAGCIVYQDLPRINLSIADGSFFKNGSFQAAINHAQKYNSNVHLLGLIGSGGVHSNLEHLLAIMQFFKEQNFHRVYLHLITDGRDSPPKSAVLYIEQIENYLTGLGFGRIASVSGRYYAMDRDYRWERTEKVYQILTADAGDKGTSAREIILSSYRRGVTDEFIVPTNVTDGGKSVALIKANDSVIFFNYRVDRPRQLTNAFVLDNFEREANLTEYDPFSVKYFKKHVTERPFASQPFKRGLKIPHLFFVTMTEYSVHVKVSAVAFPPQIVTNPLGEILSNSAKFQLRAGETEKERFVTYYFSGQRESPFLGEERLIVASPKVSTYDLAPEMSAVDLTAKVMAKLKTKKYDFAVLNYANADMVGHTGVIPATIKACETIDRCLSRLVPMVLSLGGAVFITADHGNAEEMLNPKTGGVDTEHSTYKVPFIAVSQKWQGRDGNPCCGVLADVAPTLLRMMRLPVPKTMTGRNLLENIID